MKPITKEISHLIMKLDACETSREEFNTILELEKLTKEARLSMCCNKDGEFYFDLCNKIMQTDIANYLNEFKEHHKCPGWQYYVIKIWKTNSGSYHMALNILVEKKFRNTKGLRDRVGEFRQYNVTRVLKFDKKFEGEAYKKIKYLTQDEYEEFMKIREANPNYFLPYISNILKSICELELI